MIGFFPSAYINHNGLANFLRDSRETDASNADWRMMGSTSANTRTASCTSPKNKYN